MDITFLRLRKFGRSSVKISERKKTSGSPCTFTTKVKEKSQVWLGPTLVLASDRTLPRGRHLIPMKDVTYSFSYLSVFFYMNVVFYSSVESYLLDSGAIKLSATGGANIDKSDTVFAHLEKIKGCSQTFIPQSGSGVIQNYHCQAGYKSLVKLP